METPKVDKPKQEQQDEKKRCDFCHITVDLYIDGKTMICGKWASMCPTCFSDNGLGLGIGVGQMFMFNAERKGYEKIKLTKSNQYLLKKVVIK